MERWLQIDANSWRKEADLPIGHVAAEIHKQASLPLYSARVEVAFVDQHLPEHMVKSALGLPSQADAQRTCNNFLAECVAADLIGAAGFCPADSGAS